MTEQLEKTSQVELKVTEGEASPSSKEPQRPSPRDEKNPSSGASSGSAAAPTISDPKFRKPRYTGLIRHRLIGAGCFILSLAIVGASAFNLQSLIERPGTL